MNLYDILMSDDVESSINKNIDYLKERIPEIELLMSKPHQHPHHIPGPIWNHVLLAFKISNFTNNDYRRDLDDKKIFDARLALLFHDLGKGSEEYDKPGKDGYKHYPGHPDKSAVIANKRLKEFGYDEDYINYICDLIRLHDTPILENDIFNNYDKYEVLYEIQRCDALAHNPEKLEKRVNYLKNIKSVFEEESNKDGKSKNMCK